MPGQNLNITLPQVGDENTAAIQKLLDGVQTVINDIEPKIVPGEIDFSVGDVSLESNALLDAALVDFVSQAASLSGSTNQRRLYFVGDEFYVTDGAGTAIQLTSGGQLNVGSAGQIGGDIGAGASALEYFSVDKAFEFTDEDGNWSDIEVGRVEFTPPGSAGGGDTVVVEAPGGLSESYSLVLPTATPPSTNLVTMDATGALGTTDDPSVSTVTASGNASLGSVDVTGQAVFDSGVKLGSSGADPLTDYDKPRDLVVGSNLAATTFHSGSITRVGQTVFFTLDVTVDPGNIVDQTFFFAGNQFPLGTPRSDIEMGAVVSRATGASWLSSLDNVSARWINGNLYIVEATSPGQPTSFNASAGENVRVVVSGMYLVD